MLEIARRYARAGLSVIPVKADGSKAPRRRWTEFQRRRATERELREGFVGMCGIGIVCGAVSGNLEVIDFDDEDGRAFQAFQRAVDAEGLSLAGLPLVRTPSGGHHLAYRLPEPPPGNHVLAHCPTPSASGKPSHGARLIDGVWQVRHALIETRGEGGYFIAPGSAAGTHPSGRGYELVAGSFDVPVIDMALRERLHAICRGLDRWGEPDREAEPIRLALRREPPSLRRGRLEEQEGNSDGKVAQDASSETLGPPFQGGRGPRSGKVGSAPSSRTGKVGRPGDDYNERGDFERVLENAGGVRVVRQGDMELWRRPGKAEGHSATTNFDGKRQFYAFTGNWPPFEKERPYSPFSVYALLLHGGDYHAATKALASLGYGEQQAVRREEPVRRAGAKRAPEQEPIRLALRREPPSRREGNSDAAPDTPSETLGPPFQGGGDPRSGEVGPDDPEALVLVSPPDESEAPERRRRPANQATLLVNLLRSEYVTELFLGDDNQSYARVRDGETLATMRVRSEDFKRLARYAYSRWTESPASGETVECAVNDIDARAARVRRRHELHWRIAGHGDAVFIDLGGAEWETVRIDASGYEIVTQAPVLFRRGNGMQPLPRPEAGDGLALLRELVNVDDEQFVLFVGFLVGCLNPRGPYPLLSLRGEQGTAKSTAGRIVKALIDPNGSPLKKSVKDQEALLVATVNNHVVVLDNLSHLPEWLSDDLCTLSTGGGISKRKLYSDAEEFVIDAMRPMVLTSINDVVGKSDLIDRSVLIGLDVIADDRRRPEADFWADFEAKRPQILHALYTAAACALRRLPTLTLPSLPRMADFARWVTAAEPALGWPDGTFLAAYAGNRGEANAIVLDSSPFAQKLIDFLRGNPTWSGTAAHLFDLIRPPEKTPGFPGNARGLSAKLRQIAPNLRREGVEFRAVRSRRGSALSFWRGDALFDAESGDAKIPACVTGDAKSVTQNGPTDPESVLRVTQNASVTQNPQSQDSCKVEIKNENREYESARLQEAADFASLASLRHPAEVVGAGEEGFGGVGRKDGEEDPWGPGAPVPASGDLISDHALTGSGSWLEGDVYDPAADPWAE